MMDFASATLVAVMCLYAGPLSDDCQLCWNTSCICQDVYISGPEGPYTDHMIQTIYSTV